MKSLHTSISQYDILTPMTRDDAPPQALSYLGEHRTMLDKTTNRKLLWLQERGGSIMVMAKLRETFDLSQIELAEA